MSAKKCPVCGIRPAGWQAPSPHRWCDECVNALALRDGDRWDAAEWAAKKARAAKRKEGK